MQQQIFLPRRLKNGEVVVNRLYRGRYRLPGDSKPTEVSLGTENEAEARRKLADMVRDIEQERNGAISPRLQRETAAQAMADVVEDFIKSRERLGRDHKYLLGTERRLQRITLEAGWKQVRDITLDSFEKWRGKQSFAPKTLNDCLTTLNVFLNWMVRTGRIMTNPLKQADRVSNGDYETRVRRAVTWQQVQKLRDVAGERGPLYVLAACTGLRRGELAKLQWRDVQLEGDKPAVHARASTTKNGRKASLPLHPEAVEALRSLVKAGQEPLDKVFGHLPRIKRYRLDLEAAGIPYTDGQGRVFDFHALRVTFATLLAKNGASARDTMELMRHSDMRLTTHVYTDAGHLPLRESILKLSADTQIDTQKGGKTHESRVSSVFDGKTTLTLDDLAGMDPEKYLAFDGQGNIADWALRLLGGGTTPDLLEMVRDAGFEPATPTV